MSNEPEHVKHEIGQERLLRQQACSFLGLRADPASIFLEPTTEHRCYVGQRPQPIELGHQTTYCLAAACERCPRRVAARDQRHASPPARAHSAGAAQIALARQERM